MKLLVIVALAIVGSVLSTEVDDVNRVANCVKKAMNGGLPSIDLPDFNPLRPENKTIHFDNRYIKGFLNFTSFEVYGLSDFKLEEVIPTSADDAVIFNYTVSWPKIRISGHYGHHLSIFSLPPITERVLVDIKLIEVRATGVWNMKTGKHQHLDYFYFDPTVKVVMDNSEVLPSDVSYRPILKSFVQGGYLVYSAMVRGSPLAEELSVILKAELNERWIVGGRDRIKGLLDNCQQ